MRLRFYEIAPGEVETTYTPPDHLQGYPGVLHGGIVGAIIDEVSGRAQMGTDVSNARFMYTARMDIKYRQNIPIGRLLRIVGKALRSRGRVAQAWAGIYDAHSGELLAEGTTMLVDVPKGAVSQSQLAELGWKVYPD